MNDDRPLLLPQFIFQPSVGKNLQVNILLIKDNSLTRCSIKNTIFYSYLTYQMNVGCHDLIFIVRIYF